MSISASLGKQKVIQLSGGPLAYRDRGEGPVIVFVHGVAMNGDLWRDVAPELVAAGYRCVTPDWPLGSHTLPADPGADLSPPGLAAMVAELLDRLDLDDVTLVGNDTGGVVCQLVATRHPQRLARLVLASCDGFEIFPPDGFGFLTWIGKVPGALFLMANTMRSHALRRLPMAYGRTMNQAPPRDISDSYVRPGVDSAAIRRDGKKVLAGTSTEHTLRAAKSFGDFTKPVLIAWAANDLLFPRSLAQRLADAFPNSTLEIIDDSRTFIGEDQPLTLARTIHRFIASTSTSTSAAASGEATAQRSKK